MAIPSIPREEYFERIKKFQARIKAAKLHLETRKVAGAVCSFYLLGFLLPDMACIALRYITKPSLRQTGNTVSRHIIIFGRRLCL